MHMCTTYIHTCAHTYTTHTAAHTNHTHTCVHTHICALTYTAHRAAHTFTCVHTHTRVCAHTYTTHMDLHTHVHICTYMCTHTCTHTHVHTHSRVHTHRHALPSAARGELLVPGIQWDEGADSSLARLAGWFGWKGTFKCPLAQPPAGSRDTCPRPGCSEHPECFQGWSTRCLSRQPMPVPHCPKQRNSSADTTEHPWCQSLAVKFIPRHGMGLEQFLTPKLAAWALSPSQSLPDTARHRGQCSVPHPGTARHPQARRLAGKLTLYQGN